MKLPLGPFLLIGLAVEQCVAVAGPLCSTLGPHNESPCEDNVESPDIIVTPVPTGSPTIPPTTSPSRSPTFSPTNSPTPVPTNAPSTTPSNAPSEAPSDAPSETPSDAPSVIASDTPSYAPSGTPTTSACTMTAGIFGDIEQEVFRTIEYGYELEASTTATEIEENIIPLVESAVTESILGEIFPNCTSVRRRRQLRTSRQLEVTGVTQIPDDLVLDEIICGSVGIGNECVVVSGALSIYASDEESANNMQDIIVAAIKANMDSGDFDDVSDDVVRVRYTEITSDVDHSETTDQKNSQVGNSSNGVLVGALVAAGVVVAAIGTVVYQRRHQGMETDEAAAATYFGEQTTAS